MAYSKASPYAIQSSGNKRTDSMVMRSLLLLAAIGAVTATAPAADARPRDREQDAAYRATRDGRFLPLPFIESRVVPYMARHGAAHIGTELDIHSGRYRLKFSRGPRVMWVDLDARTGDVIGKSGF